MIDERHKAILPPSVWGDGKPEGVRGGRQERMADGGGRPGSFSTPSPAGAWGSLAGRRQRLHRFLHLAFHLRLSADLAGVLGQGLPGLRPALWPHPGGLRKGQRQFRPGGASRPRSPSTSPRPSGRSRRSRVTPVRLQLRSLPPRLPGGRLRQIHPPLRGAHFPRPHEGRLVEPRRRHGRRLRRPHELRRRPPLLGVPVGRARRRQLRGHHRGPQRRRLQRARSRSNGRTSAWTGSTGQPRPPPSSASWTFQRAPPSTPPSRRRSHEAQTSLRNDRRRPGAFIGAVHRIAAAMDGQAELVAGAFSSDPARSRASGADLFLAPPGLRHLRRDGEARRRPGRPADRLDFVVIVTPNHQHFGPAKLFLEAGFNVVCDKPVTFNLAEAVEAARDRPADGKVFVLTHNYTGNAMVKQARELVKGRRPRPDPQGGGRVPQGWLSTRLEKRPARSRPPGAPIPSAAARPAASATSAPTPRTSPATSPGSGSIRSAPTSRPSSRAASSTTTATSWSASRAARRGCSTPRRSAWARRTTSHPRLRHQGGPGVAPGASRTSWSVKYPDQAGRRSGGAATATWARRPSARPASPPATPRATSRPSATSTARPFARSRPKVPGRKPPRDLDFPTIDDGVAGHGLH
jgi:hypothetical protein